jgi:glutaredoxin
MTLILLGTSACHLCEQAEKILTTLFIQFPTLQLELVDIATATQWQSRYAIKIPVIYHPDSDSELDWPFNEHDIITFIKYLNHDSKV